MTTEMDPTNTTTSTTTPTPNEEEDPSLSSASLCIEFHMMGETFRPVFTHQAFPGETIRGYHPPLKTLMECTAQAEASKKHDDSGGSGLLHSSHINHEAASKELSINVTLAPSCETCHVEIATEKKRLPRRHSVRSSKRPRLGGDAAATVTEESTKPTNAPIVEADSSTEQPEANEVGDKDDDDDGSFQEEDTTSKHSSEPDYSEKDTVDDDDSEFEVDEGVSEVEDDDGANNKEGATRTSRMPTKDILQSMKKGLPEVVAKNNAKNSSVEESYLRRPLGVELQDYSVQGKDFVLSLATGVESSSFHNKVQRLALWFIETGDDVDIASQEGGFWNVLYLFRKHKRNQYSLAGYITLFHFHAPFKKPQPGYVVRICQALVLPPYQRMGHGKRLLTCVMDIAHGQYSDCLPKNKKGGKDDEIVEINVESPAPAFVLLRNRTDYDCFLQSLENKQPWIESQLGDDASSSPKVTNADFFTSIVESDITQAAAKAKIIPRQIQIVQELYKLRQLQEYLEASKIGGDEREALEKRFRLMVKKRLNKEHRENLSGLRTKAEKQAFLEKEYNECLKSYRVILPKAKTG